MSSPHSPFPILLKNLYNSTLCLYFPLFKVSINNKTKSLPFLIRKIYTPVPWEGDCGQAWVYGAPASYWWSDLAQEAGVYIGHFDHPRLEIDLFANVHRCGDIYNPIRCEFKAFSHVFNVILSFSRSYRCLVKNSCASLKLQIFSLIHINRQQKLIWQLSLFSFIWSVPVTLEWKKNKKNLGLF